jgi:hypothetical protein
MTPPRYRWYTQLPLVYPFHVQSVQSTTYPAFLVWLSLLLLLPASRNCVDLSTLTFFSKARHNKLPIHPFEPSHLPRLPPPRDLARSVLLFLKSCHRRCTSTISFFNHAHSSIFEPHTLLHLQSIYSLQPESHQSIQTTQKVIPFYHSTASSHCFG